MGAVNDTRLNFDVTLPTPTPPLKGRGFLGFNCMDNRERLHRLLDKADLDQLKRF